MRILTTSTVLLAVTVSATALANAQTPSKAEQREALNEAAIRQATDVAKAKEAQIARQLRGIEAQLASEQELLERRLNYAGQLRAKGLKDEDAGLLRKAEEVERQAVALYQQRVAQFEKIRVRSQAGSPSVRVPTPVQPRANAAAEPTRAPSPSARSNGRSSTRRSWWPFGR